MKKNHSFWLEFLSLFHRKQPQPSGKQSFFSRQAVYYFSGNQTGEWNPLKQNAALERKTNEKREEEIKKAEFYDEFHTAIDTDKNGEVSKREWIDAYTAMGLEDAINFSRKPTDKQIRGYLKAQKERLQTPEALEEK